MPGKEKSLESMVPRSPRLDSPICLGVMAVSRPRSGDLPCAKKGPALRAQMGGAGFRA